MSTSACFMTSAIWSEVDRRAVVLVEVRDERAVGGEHAGVAGRGLVGQLDRQRVEQRRRVAGHHAGAADPGQQHAGEQRSGDDDRRGELERGHGTRDCTFSDIAGECTCRERLSARVRRRRAGRIRVRGVPVGVSASEPVSSAPITRSPSRSCTSPAVAGTVRTPTSGWALVNRSARCCSRAAWTIRSACTRSAAAARSAPSPPASTTSSAAPSARVAESAVVAGGWVRLMHQPGQRHALGS